MSEAEWIAFLQRPEFPAFNRAMLDNPEDDLPRLVFADWMDENCPDAEVNRAVRESISGEHRQAAWPNLRRNRKWNLTLVRGRVTIWVNLQLRPPQRRPPRTVLEAAWQAGWVEGMLFGRLHGHFVGGWFDDPPVRGVRVVGLAGDSVSAFMLAHRLTPSRMPHLQTLALNGQPTEPGFVTELTASAVFARLVHLSLCGMRLTQSEVEALAGSPHLSGLNTLALGACDIQDAGAAALAQSPHLAKLERLDLDMNGITDAGAAALADSPYLCEAIRAQWRRSADVGA